MKKQLVIGLVFVLVIGGFVYGFFDYFLIIEPTCSDNVKNGQEEGVDCGLLACGLTCEPAIMPLNVQLQKLIEVRDKDYDFVAHINNPNSLFGASHARYEINMTKKDGAILQRAGTFFILPGQTRYVIVSGITSNSILSNASIQIKEVDWEKVNSFENIGFPIQRKDYRILDSSGGSELEAVVLNSSDFDFDKVEVGVILFDEKGNIIAVNKTDIRTFISRTERYFKVVWPSRFPSEVARQDIEILTNVFENSNFIRQHGTQERFQKYY